MVVFHGRLLDCQVIIYHCMYIMVDLQHHALSHILTICVMVKTWIWVWVKIRYPKIMDG
jgi:hypothetical protein